MYVHFTTIAKNLLVTLDYVMCTQFVSLLDAS
jgi:hypothetical protein